MYDFFISFKCTCEGQKTKDSEIAKEIYDELLRHDTKIFFSDEELFKNGSAKFMQEINEALRSASIFVLIASDPAYLNEGWVAQEWSSYLNLMMSDNSRKLFTVLVDLSEADLPPLLGPLESFRYEDGIDKIITYLMQAYQNRHEKKEDNSILKYIDAAYALSGWKDEEYLFLHYEETCPSSPELVNFLMANSHITNQNYSQAVPYVEKLLKGQSVLGAYLMGKLTKKGYCQSGALHESIEVLQLGRQYWETFAKNWQSPNAEILFLYYEKNLEKVTSAEYMTYILCQLMHCYNISCEIMPLFQLDAKELEKKLSCYKKVLLITDDLQSFSKKTERENKILHILSSQGKNKFCIAMNSMRQVNFPKNFRKYTAYDLQRNGIERYCRYLLHCLYEGDIKSEVNSNVQG